MTKIQNPKRVQFVIINYIELSRNQNQLPMARNLSTLLNVRGFGHWLLRFVIYL